MSNFTLNQNISIGVLDTVVRQCGLQIQTVVGEDQTIKELIQKSDEAHYYGHRLGTRGYATETEAFTHFKRQDLEKIFTIPRITTATNGTLFNSSRLEIAQIAGSDLNTDEEKLMATFNAIDSLVRINQGNKLERFKTNFPDQVGQITTVLDQLKLEMQSFVDDLRKPDLNIPKSLIEFIAKRWSLNENTSKPTISPQAVISSSSEGDTFLPLSTRANTISPGTDSFN